MAHETKMIAFGPVPSRRLGHSLGINNIPPKICTYSCIYCQLGRSLHMQIEREEFYHPEEIAREVEQKVKEATGRGEPIDYLTFVPDGEPTLDIHLGREIALLKGLGIKIAVITNASLIWREDVQNALCKADWVSVKIDAVTQGVWRKIDRPYGTLKLNNIFQDISEFSQAFKGELATETMLVQDVNDTSEELERIADFIAGLSPATEHVINLAYHVFREKSLDVEYLIGYEGNAFAFTGNVVEDLLSITSVHPMREDAVQTFLTRAQTNWSVIEKLLYGEKLRELDYRGNTFYMRTLTR